VLQPSISLVLDCEAEVFVWTGRASGGYGRWGALTLAKRLCAARGGFVSGSVVSGGGAVALERETEGCEGAMFRAKFGRWHWVSESNLAAHLRAPSQGVPALDPQEETARMPPHNPKPLTPNPCPCPCPCPCRCPCP